MSVHYELEKWERERPEHQQFLERVVLACHPQQYVAPSLSPDLMKNGILNPYHYRDDFSFVIRVGGEPVGMVVLTVPRDNEAWELGLLHVLPPWQRKGIGSSVLERLEEKVRASRRGLVTSWFFSPRSIPNGIPALQASTLSFFTKRGYYLKPSSEAAFRLTPSSYRNNQQKLTEMAKKNMADGFSVSRVRLGETDYEATVQKCATFCRREKAPYWAQAFCSSFMTPLRTGISIIEKQGELVAFAVYTFEPIAPSGWGYGQHWGPILIAEEHRRRGLASWLVRDSLDALLNAGAQEVFLWATFGGMPSRMYERFGFQPVCPWFSIEKKF